MIQTNQVIFIYFGIHMYAHMHTHIQITKTKEEGAMHLKENKGRVHRRDRMRKGKRE